MTMHPHRYLCSPYIGLYPPSELKRREAMALSGGWLKEGDLSDQLLSMLGGDAVESALAALHAQRVHRRRLNGEQRWMMAYN